MKIFAAVIWTFLLLALPACTSAGQGEKLVIVSPGGAQNVFHVEIADTPEEREHGLMDRKDMSDDHGMLFVFDDVAERIFWMKDTYMPLDIVFIGTDATIHRIVRSATPLSLQPLPSEGPVLHVLELKGGTADRLGIREGDVVRHKAFGNAVAE
jgi:uncharacterized membrane protein (UPF0127 family)